MLTMIPKPPELGLASRRALKAAALTIELAGGSPDACSMSAVGRSPTCLHYRDWNLLLLPTTCVSPLHVAEAVELVRRLTNESAVIVRLDTALNPPISFVTMDAVLRLHGDVVVLRGLLPCVRSADSRLALVRYGASSPTLVFGSEGLVAHSVLSAADTWDVEGGIANAAAFFRSRIWGGL